KSKRNIVFPFSRRSLLRRLKRVIVTVGKPVHHKVKRELTPEEKAERLQWALTHENWTVATWAQGSWSSAAVLQMRYHRDAFKWKEININMWDTHSGINSGRWSSTTNLTVPHPIYRTLCVL